MSNTRHAQPGGEFRQERYASSPALERGLNALLVKNRCTTLTDPRDIELAWFIQYQSYQQGGIEKLTADLLAAFPERLGTPAMLQIGAKPDGIYNANQVRAVRVTSSPFHTNDFLLQGEVRERFGIFTKFTLEQLEANPGLAQTVKAIDKRSAEREKELAAESKNFPKSYPVASFLEICRDMFNETVPGLLTQFCLDPGFSVDQLQVTGERAYWEPVFHDLHGALLEYVDQWEKECFAGLIVTDVGGKVLEALNYAEDQAVLVLAQGNPRLGKSYVGKRWCLARPGKRRFVSLTEASSDKEFFREIANAIGSSASYGFKTNELRERVNEVLQAGHLTLVIDEAHYLWPQRNFREALPKRINWVISALNNYEVPVAMIATPQFTAAQQRVEKNTHWSSAQLIGRISYCINLPENIDAKDLRAIARFHVPEATSESIEVLVDYATASQKHLAGIEQAVKAARRQAHLNGRDTVTHADIMRAFDVTVTPSDAALNAAVNSAPAPQEGRQKRQSKVYTSTARQPLIPISTPVPERESGAALVTPDRKNKRSGHASLFSV